MHSPTLCHLIDHMLSPQVFISEIYPKFCCYSPSQVLFSLSKKPHTILHDDFCSLIHVFMASTRHFPSLTIQHTQPMNHHIIWTFADHSGRSGCPVYRHCIFFFNNSIFSFVYLFSPPRVTYKKGVICVPRV